jgi:triosephosphate isomerase
MAVRPRPLVAGNWKMNGLRESLSEVEKICALAGVPGADKAEIVICPPVTLLLACVKICDGSAVALGGQDCHWETSGAYTGDISAEMLKDAGASFVILGHSERRAGHHESNETVRAKAVAALRTGLSPIICVGETGAEREEGMARAVVAAQLSGSVPQGCAAEQVVIAYEPVWAIGSGLTPTRDDIAKMHGFIRTWIMEHLSGQGGLARILYGGSVKPGNAAELMEARNVDGALVGGASLAADDFMAIAGVYG